MNVILDNRNATYQPEKVRKDESVLPSIAAQQDQTLVEQGVIRRSAAPQPQVEQGVISSKVNSAAEPG
jgi:hypothetical protein